GKQHAALGCARLIPKAVHLITGGLGRIGVELAERLVRQGGHVVLTTRKTIDQIPPSIRDRIGAAKGAIRVKSLDPTCPDEVLRCLNGLCEQGQKLGMIFHCAGLADLKYLGDQTLENLMAENAPKIRATAAIDEAIDRLQTMHGKAPSHVVLFSSLAAELGGLGMAGYAAANRYLDRFAIERSQHQTQSSATRWVSIAWDDWGFDYGKEQTAAYAKTRAQLALPVSDALNALDCILGTDSEPMIAVSATDLQQRWHQWRTRTAIDTDGDMITSPPAPAAVTSPPRQDCGLTATLASESPRKRINSVPNGATPSSYAEPRIVAAIIEAYRMALGAETITPASDFYDLGGDSLLAVDVIAAIEPTLPQTVQPQLPDILEYPTPKRLAEVLIARLGSTIGHSDLDKSEPLQTQK
ncbi:MAG: beta-ketoacyl reductase, partial [Pseudomonadota bacterium]